MGSLSGIIVSLPQVRNLAMANTLDLILCQARSPHMSNMGSDAVATHNTIQEAFKKKIDDPGPTRYFICQLLDAEGSTQTSFLQRPDQPSNKTPQATGFGTLIKLPSEVRQQIWHEVLKAENYNASYLGSEPIWYMGGRNWHNMLRRRKYPPKESYTLFETFSISVFRSDSYSIGHVTFNKTYTEREFAESKEHLPRLTSHAVKGELEDFYLRNHIFGFECPKFLDTFLGQLSRHQTLQLRRISLMVFAESCWARVIERLPKTINVVLITLDAAHAYAYLELSPHHESVKLSMKLIGKVLSAADVLRNQILRQLPHARVFLVGSLFEHLDASDRAAFEILSADKAWSNVDRKILL